MRAFVRSQGWARKNAAKVESGIVRTISFEKASDEWTEDRSSIRGKALAGIPRFLFTDHMQMPSLERREETGLGPSQYVVLIHNQVDHGLINRLGRILNTIPPNSPLK